MSKLLNAYFFRKKMAIGRIYPHQQARESLWFLGLYAVGIVGTIALAFVTKIIMLAV